MSSYEIFASHVVPKFCKKMYKNYTDITDNLRVNVQERSFIFNIILKCKKACKYFILSELLWIKFVQDQRTYREKKKCGSRWLSRRSFSSLQQWACFWPSKCHNLDFFTVGNLFKIKFSSQLIMNRAIFMDILKIMD